MKNRYKVESEIKLADNKSEATNLTTKLEHNNKTLRDTAKKNPDDSKENEVKGAIKNHIMPMIENKLPILTKLILVISMLIMQGKTQ